MGGEGVSLLEGSSEGRSCQRTRRRGYSKEEGSYDPTLALVRVTLGTLRISQVSLGPPVLRSGSDRYIGNREDRE